MPTQSAVFTKADISRMKASVLPPAENFHREERKKHLKKLSNDRMQHWPNTLEALRKKKESYLKEKEEEEERKRRELDVEEAELRRKTRKEAIDRANAIIYEQTDKMKYLRSQELLSDVLYERTFQIDEKEKLKGLEKQQNAKHHEEILRQVRAAEEKEREKLAAQERKMKEVTAVRVEQLEEVKKRRAAEAAEQEAIGIAMKRQAQEELVKERRLREERQEHIKESNAKMVAANEQLKAVREELRAQEAAAEKKREDEVDVIENRKKVRKALEIRRFEKAQVTRQKIIDAATLALESHTTKTEARLQKQVADHQAKVDREEEEKRLRREKEWNAIVASRAEQVARKKERVVKEKQEEECLLNLLQEKAKIAHEREMDKEQKARERTKQIKAEQQAHARRVAEQRAEERILEMERDRLLREANASDDAKFKAVCEKEIEKYASAGKPLIPLYRALHHTAPEILPASDIRRKKK